MASVTPNPPDSHILNPQRPHPHLEATQKSPFGQHSGAFPFWVLFPNPSHSPETRGLAESLPLGTPPQGNRPTYFFSHSTMSSAVDP